MYLHKISKDCKRAISFRGFRRKIQSVVDKLKRIFYLLMKNNINLHLYLFLGKMLIIICSDFSENIFAHFPDSWKFPNIPPGGAAE